MQPTRAEHGAPALTETVPPPPAAGRPPPATLAPRLGPRAVVVLTFLGLAAPIGALEWSEARHLDEALAARARVEAVHYADHIAARLSDRALELRLAGLTLWPPHAVDAAPQLGAAPVLRAFVGERGDFGALTVRAADGTTPLWSTVPLPPRPDVAGFGAARNPSDLLLGHAHGGELPLRWQVRAADARVLGYIDTTYPLAALLRDVPEGAARTPWVLRVVDRRDGLLGQWEDDRLVPATGVPTPVVVDVPGMPLQVQAGWHAGYARTLWWRDGAQRWALEALLLGTAAALAWAVRRGRLQRRAQRAALRDAARVDPLTGMLSREAFETGLAGWSERLRGEGRQLAVMVLDLYRFGVLNARWGFEGGNAVLRELARRVDALPERIAVGRVGGDALAVAYTDLDPADLAQRMEQVLGTMRQPFEVGRDHVRHLTAALGCALYPADCAQPEELLGLAEAALFNRAQREVGSVTTDLDPYGPLSAELLRWAHRFLGGRGERIAHDFYEYVGTDPDNRAILDLLDPDEYKHLEQRQGAYLLRLLEPELSAQTHSRLATDLGELHALLGVPQRALVAAVGWYGRMLTDLSQRIPGRLSQRQILVRTFTRRLEIDLALQSEAAQTLQARLQRGVQQLAQDLHAAQRWAEVMDAMIELLAGWPHVACCAVYSQDAHGSFLLEAQSPGYEALVHALRSRGTDPHAQPLMMRAWSDGHVATAAAVHRDAHAHAPLMQGLSAAGVRSVAAVPIEDGQSHIQAVVMLYGRLPNQFDTVWMRDLLGGLRQNVARVLQSMRRADATRVSAEERALWRRQLFAGGLQTYVQPLVRLSDGACVKVEALVRLRLPDGRMVPPGTFLPVLSDQELNRLFIEGLHDALDALVAWRRDGLELDLSFNLPPVTLRHPDCARWVGAALHARAVAPHRVTFELLENEDITDQDAHTRGIFALHELGVQLAMDDLGSGYSSLLRLRRLPFDLVKIDQGLIRTAQQSPRRSIALIGALVRLAKGLDLGVAIEGLETDELVEVARVLGADLAQGYALARPMPVDELPRWVASRDTSAPPPHPTSRLGVLTAHWLWEQTGQDAGHAEPAEAHRQCAVGRYLARHGLHDGPLGRAHAAMHRHAQAGGVHDPAYMQARELFYEQFGLLPSAETQARPHAA